MIYSKKEREQYKEYRARVCDRLSITENQYNAFRRLGNKLHKIYEDECNGLLTEDEYFATTLLYETEAGKKARANNLHAYFQRDPRGATIYLSREIVTDRNYNKWGVECIY